MLFLKLFYRHNFPKTKEDLQCIERAKLQRKKQDKKHETSGKDSQVL